MRILCIGDVVGGVGCRFLRSKLPSLKRFHGVDFVICNGENSADGNGITPLSAQYLFDSGVDAITLGNHSFRRREVYDGEFPVKNHARQGHYKYRYRQACYHARQPHGQPRHGGGA